MTAAGPVRLLRAYLLCPICGLGEYAADAVLGIGDFLSDRMTQLACFAGTVATSFAKATELLYRLAGLRVGEESLRTRCHSQGERLCQQPTRPAELAADAFGKAEGNVEFHTDATKVNTLEAGWKDLKAAVALKRAAGPPVDVERWQERSLPEPSTKTAFAALESIDTFEQRWRPWMAQLGATETACIDLHGDGAEWIWNAASVQFVGCRQCLDFFHASQHLAEAARAIHGDGTEAFEKAFAAGRKELLGNGWQGLCQFVADNRDAADAAGRPDALDALLAYFANHAGRIDYAARLGQGRSIGSGPIEGYCKTLGLRLKSRGARWGLANVDRMAALISLHESGVWDTYWALAE